MILLIDNYDSFTEPLPVFLRAGAEVVVRRNDEIALDDIDALAPQKIVISPGPCTPSESGISLAVIQHYAGKLPILGVCTVTDCAGLWRHHCPCRESHAWQNLTDHTHRYRRIPGLNNPLTVTRYHSLIIDPPTLPACFEVTARSETQEIMGIRHREYDLEGVQFHPESILSEQARAAGQFP